MSDEGEQIGLIILTGKAMRFMKEALDNQLSIVKTLSGMGMSEEEEFRYMSLKHLRETMDECKWAIMVPEAVLDEFRQRGAVEEMLDDDMDDDLDPDDLDVEDLEGGW